MDLVQDMKEFTIGGGLGLITSGILVTVACFLISSFNAMQENTSSGAVYLPDEKSCMIEMHDRKQSLKGLEFCWEKRDENKD